MITTWLGFAPDLDPSLPGIFTDCAGLIPTRKGFRPRPTGMPVYLALPSAALGEVFLAQFLDGTTRLFAGTATHLYEGVSGVWNEVDGGQTFSGGKWRFAMFGNDCIATNGTDAPQVNSTSGNFAALGGTPPRAPLVETLYGFTFLFESDNWHCSGIGTDNIWNNSVASESASGPLIDTPGPVSAARKLGRAVLAYKAAGGIYRGDFVDLPLIWNWTLLDRVKSAAGQGSVVDLGTYHAFIGSDDFYLCDGSTAWPIPGPDGNPNPIKEWFFANANGTQLANIEGYYDETNETVYWYFSSTNASPAGSLDTVIAWNFRTNKWTKDAISIEAVIRPFFVASTSWSYDKFSNTYGTYNGIPNLPYDSALFFGSNQSSPGYIDTNHVLNALTGPVANSKIVTGDYGDDVYYYYLNKLRPVFSLFPTLPASTVQAIEFHRHSLGDALSQGDTENISTNGSINLRASDAFHRWELDFTGNFEIIGLDPDLIEDGTI